MKSETFVFNKFTEIEMFFLQIEQLNLLLVGRAKIYAKPFFFDFIKILKQKFFKIISGMKGQKAFG